jgi:hypothetical protein
MTRKSLIDVIQKNKRTYSGKWSAKFWKRINAIPTSEGGMQLYIMGCILQDVEDRVLREIEQQESKRKLVAHD